MVLRKEIIELTGRVLNRYGESVRGVGLTIWQANTFGRYAHSNFQPCTARPETHRVRRHSIG
jgi:protocatechuate 3,4-dioxygenase beta subunit